MSAAPWVPTHYSPSDGSVVRRLGRLTVENEDGEAWDVTYVGEADSLWESEGNRNNLHTIVWLPID